MQASATIPAPAATALGDGQLRQADELMPRLSIRPTFLRLFDARRALRVYAALTPGQQKALEVLARTRSG